jgi:hypothetical protein
MDPEPLQHLADRRLVGVEQVGDLREALHVDKEAQHAKVPDTDILSILHWNLLHAKLARGMIPHVL